MSAERSGNAPKSKKDILVNNVTSSARKAFGSFMDAHRGEVKAGITTERRARQKTARAEVRAQRPENPGLVKGLGFLGIDVVRIAADVATGIVGDELRVISKVNFRDLLDTVADGLEDGLHDASRELRNRRKTASKTSDSANPTDSK